MKINIFGAGFKKPDVSVADNPYLITFDGESVYFFGITEREAKKYLDGVTLLNGKTGWLAYMLQEVFYNDLIEEELYDALFDALYAGTINGPEKLTKGTIHQWLDSIAPDVQAIISLLLKKSGIDRTAP